MRDLDAVDRQLAELAEGSSPNIRALLGRLLGNDRSLERLNELLDGLGAAPVPSSARPPAPLRDPLGAPAQRSGTLRGVTAPQFAPDGPAPALRGGAGSDAPSTRANPPGVRGSLPPRIVSPLAPVQGDRLKTATPWPPVQASPQNSAQPRARDTLVDAAVPPPALAPLLAVVPEATPAKIDEVELDAATAALFGVTFPPAAKVPSVPIPPPAAEVIASAPAPIPTPFALPEPGPDPARESRANMRALLDKEIDPNDFPSSHPPRARSIPPPLPKPPAGAQDSFEMLIDDEADIMEIDDVELEEIE